MFIVPYKQNLILEFDYYSNDQDVKYTLVQTQEGANYSLETRVLFKFTVLNFIALYSYFYNLCTFPNFSLPYFLMDQLLVFTLKKPWK